jgi:carboxypeptidase Q
MPTLRFAAALCLLAASSPAAAQTFRSPDPVIRRIWSLGMDSSQVERLAQVLDDSIGMRLSGTSGFQSAVDWLTGVYRSLGVTVRQERYATTKGWRLGPVAMSLTTPHVQTLDAHLLAFSPGTGGRTVEAEAVLLPALKDSTEAPAWLNSIKNKFVLIDAPEPMCRAPQELERYARPATVTRLNEQRQAARREWTQRQRALGGPAQLARRLQRAGAAGVLSSTWSNGWGVNKIFDSETDRIPSVDLACEDYGLVARLAANTQGPRLRLLADAEARPDQPMFNVIAELKGRELPNEYVLLSAHLDSWHGATGATDNGTGTITMLEAMRILSRTYPNPRRTILVGHWGGEEQGTQGSRSFGEDHPEIMDGMQVVFNQDNGTWRAELIEGQGFLGAGANLARWLSFVPTEISSNLRLDVPGAQENSGSDHTSFLCRGVPAFRLQSNYTEYRQYTWHTNRDTYDKLVFDDLKNNATLAAMLAYEASEDPTRVPRDKAILPLSPTGQPRNWPTCRPARRTPLPPDTSATLQHDLATLHHPANPLGRRDVP